MTRSKSVPVAELVPIAQIDVINPRVRNQRTFRDIVSNIATLGLKRPITVTRRTTTAGARYELVCGQGRLEAFQALGQTEIPAIVIEAETEDCLVMSLVENLARRHHQALDLMHDIEGLKRRGYSNADIARKTDLTVVYVKDVIHLIETGETRLLRAVESGHIPVSVAVEIASANDADVQRVLQEAYDKKLLRGHKLTIAKKLIERRRRRGKDVPNAQRRKTKPITLEAILRTYQEDTHKKRILVRKADVTRGRLVFVVEALRTILSDENFITLLRAEGIDTLPRNLSERLQAVQTG
jgi:ParB family chromosome partitioning protein